MANHRRIPINGDPSENGRAFQEWVLHELRAQRASQKRLLGAVGRIGEELEKRDRDLVGFARWVGTWILGVGRRLDRIEGDLREVLRRLPPKP